MKFCCYCGIALPEDAMFCYICGKNCNENLDYSVDSKPKWEFCEISLVIIKKKFPDGFITESDVCLYRANSIGPNKIYVAGESIPSPINLKDQAF